MTSSATAIGPNPFLRRLSVVAVGVAAALAVLAAPLGADAAPRPQVPTDPPPTSTPADPSTTTTTTPAPCALTYTVQRGDGWIRIASMHGVAVSALYAANSASASTKLFVGKVLCLPAGATTTTTTTTTTAPPPVCAMNYVVQAGDGWQRIATRHSISLSALLAVNAATTSTKLFAGRSICLPEGATTTTTSSTVAPPVTSPPTTTPGSGGSIDVPAGSGSGRRVVYSKTAQRVWIIEVDESVTRTYLVSGKMAQPRPGSYQVFSRSSITCSLSSPGVCMRWMVRFTRNTANTDNIGFHEIPRRGNVPLQTDAQLGRPLSGGCVRQATADALFMWNWAGVGTRVVVLP